MAITDRLTRLTADLPGTGGVIKQRPDDFLVEELPLYEPCGEGEHLYLCIEKRSLTSFELMRRVARCFNVQRRQVGHAGLKDKHAITRQHISVHLPGQSHEADQEGIAKLTKSAGIEVLWADRHTNKLRVGHHGGNRFVIYLREVEPSDVVKVRPIVETIQARGLPNYIGPQRFGYRQNSHLLGKLLLLEDWQGLLDEMLGRPVADENEAMRQARLAYEQGDYELALSHCPRENRFDRQALDALRQGKSPRNAVRSIDRKQRSFLISAAQSAIFNEVLNERIRSDAFDRLLPGDLAWKHDSRAVFEVDEATARMENEPGGRVLSMEVSPSGPLWGAEMMRAMGRPGEIEQRALASTGLSEQHFEQQGDLAPTGQRRSLRVRPANLEYSGGADDHGPFIRLAFDLPRGAYATVLVSEITKSPDDKHFVVSTAD